MNGTASFFLLVLAYVAGSTLGVTALIMRWADSEQARKDKETAARLWGELPGWAIAKVSQARARAVALMPNTECDSGEEAR